MNVTQVKKLILDCAAYWPHSPIPEHAERAWLTMLEKYDYDQAAAAVAKIAESGCEFPPIVGKIRRAIEADESQDARLRRHTKDIIALADKGKDPGLERINWWISEYPAMRQHIPEKYLPTATEAA